jgi:hypothetical protein
MRDPGIVRPRSVEVVPYLKRLCDPRGVAVLYWYVVTVECGQCCT